MNLLIGILISLRALRVKQLRSTLTMLGIIIGVAAVITMIAVGSGAQARVEEQIKGLGTNLIILSPGSVTAGGVRMGAGSRSSLTEDDSYAIQRELPAVQASAPTLRGTGQVVAAGNNWSTVFFGVTPEYLEARNWVVATGKMFETADLTGSAKVALLGETVAQNLFGGSDPIGQTIRIRKVPFVVIGTLGRKDSTGWAGPGRPHPDAVSTARTSFSEGLRQAAPVGSRSIDATRGHEEAETDPQHHRQANGFSRQDDAQLAQPSGGLQKQEARAA